jgi:CxxC-x17-CxxC domain-containing protein
VKFGGPGKEVMDYEDRELTCSDCGEAFQFTARDQEFFATKGFQEPKRCPACRRARKAQRDGGGGGDYGGRERREHEVVCADCGKITTVPFEPRGDRPVYCRECFDSRRNRGGY